MKKSLIFVAIVIAATTLFAETMSCESKMGECTYEITSKGIYSEECLCRNGDRRGEGGNDGSMPTILPTEEECLANLEKKCKDAGFKCENEAGECIIEQHGEYICRCKGVIDGYQGTSEFNEETSEEENCNRLVEICGTEPATVRDVCEDQEILNQCINYVKTFAAGCYEPLTDEDVEEILDSPSYYYDYAHAQGMPGSVPGCCQESELRKEYQTHLECLENCKDDNCCETCHVKLVPHDDEITSEDDADAANTEAPATGAAPADKADGNTAAPAENKEESKSDGCSLLFI
jgi:hypothetical protein